MYNKPLNYPCHTCVLNCFSLSWVTSVHSYTPIFMLLHRWKQSKIQWWPKGVRHGIVHADSSATVESSQGYSGLVIQQLVWLLRETHACLCAQSLSVVSDSATPWTVARQTPLSMALSQQGYWIGLPSPPSGDLSDPGIEPAFPVALHWRVDSSLEPPGKPPEETSVTFILPRLKKVSSPFLVSKVFLTEDAALLMV